MSLQTKENDKNENGRSGKAERLANRKGGAE